MVNHSPMDFLALMTNFTTLKNLVGSTDYEIFKEIFPDLIALDNTPQDAYYHAEGDVWTHTKMVLDALLSLPEYKTAEFHKQFIMYYSALLHDISKPPCTVHEDDGRITSAGHSKRGSVDARIILWKMGIPFFIRENICNIIATHQIPFFAFDDKPKAGKVRTPQYLAHSLSWQLPLDCLLAVAKSDMIGRHYELKQDSLDDIELFTEISKEEGCYDKPYPFPDDVTMLKYFRSVGDIPANFPFYKETGSHVFVMSGIPASGKSSWIEKKNLPVVSFDDAKEELDLKHSDNCGAAYQLVVSRAKEMLRKHEDFIWDATHLSKQMRDKTLDLLYAYDARVTIVYVEQPEKVVKERNIQRNGTLTNKKIESMLFKWEVPTKLEAHEILYLVNE